jgi:hypothetical protein
VAVAAPRVDPNLTRLIAEANALLIGHPRAKVLGEIEEATKTRPKAKVKPVMKSRRDLHAPSDIQNPTATVPTQGTEKTHWIASSRL